MLNQSYFMKKLLPASKGFTLIELMVVVTIIAFLSVIGVAAFTNAQKQARDGRRKADIEAISTALEANFGKTKTGEYPAISCTDGLSDIFANGKCPKPPTGTGNYIGIPFTAAATYEVCADLEGTGSTSDASEKEFCRKNQQ